MRKEICWVAATVGLLLGTSLQSAERPALVSKWGRFEREFKSSKLYQNPLNDVTLAVVFTSPSGESRSVNAFWDGGLSWKVRFSPGEVGRWIYTAVCSDPSNKGLEEKSGMFTCTAASGRTRFDQHGPIRISNDGRFLMHEDGTPFFWLADTAWNGALLSTAEQWARYIDTRLRQGFSAVQWVTTQWRASPNGNRLGQLAFSGQGRIEINPIFFQELDRRVEALNAAGILNVPVLLWAIGGGSNPKVNPGFSLPEDQAILLARYMVARWGANDVVWILGGDGDYRGKNADKWKRIGRAVFGKGWHAPVVMHPGGMHWILDDFASEPWVGIHGYQSGHGDDDTTLRWLMAGPPAKDWKKEPPRPFINLEPPYEFHIAYQSKQRITPHQVRRAVYWSLLVSPTAGVTYGGHGIWGWDDGTKPPTDHPYTGVPLAWSHAMRMPGAEQMHHLSGVFKSVPFWRLRPAPGLIAKQPGEQSPHRFIAAAKTLEGDAAIIYTPVGGAIELNQAEVPPGAAAEWINPRSGERIQAVVGRYAFQTPDDEDWVLLLRGK